MLGGPAKHQPAGSEAWKTCVATSCGVEVVWRWFGVLAPVGFESFAPSWHHGTMAQAGAGAGAGGGGGAGAVTEWQADCCCAQSLVCWLLVLSLVDCFIGSSVG